MSSCLSGGGRTYQFDLEIISKSRWVSASRASSPPSSSSSPASTLSESSNSPISISTRRTRTPRKRPNQIYNEAAALLSTVYPNIFSAKHLEKPRKFANFEDYFSDESSDLLLPLPGFEAASFLLRQPVPAKSDPRIEPKCSPRFPENQCGNIKSISKSPQLDDEFNDGDEFDAESILDEETGEGIDSILGNLSASAAASDEAEATASYGIPVGLGFGTRKGIRPLKRVGEASWWNFSTVDVVEISPKLNNRASDSNLVDKKQKNKNKKKAVKTPPQPKTPTSAAASATAAAREQPKSGGLMLKLNYDSVLDAWSRCGRSFSGESPVPDVPAGLADFDSFAKNGTEREGTGPRCKEKRPARLFSKKVEFQVKKAHANERPRVKGRFVRRPDSSGSDPK
ncbi:protein CHLOROPLAST IMPORT APPARATUS 2 isoform X1 [Syzygium oleosum]|uniref:protein CHLOROPLAST IMPORT APPARATUS 2 isoform X1 n=1 Tax=Syzygium oleosum TaxID=219896 RepID=UPI0011D232BC|nr:protein CHLOROPLAST IMPORT APPARATUS 2 isoform X1 [Syzygium oleosum]